jgi:hypothetical protein
VQTTAKVVEAAVPQDARCPPCGALHGLEIAEKNVESLEDKP